MNLPLVLKILCYNKFVNSLKCLRYSAGVSTTKGHGYFPENDMSQSCAVMIMLKICGCMFGPLIVSEAAFVF